MEWLQDRYVVLAGDIAQDAVSRAYDMDKRVWSTVSGTYLTAQRDSPYWLKYFAVRVIDGTYGNLRAGLVCHLYVVDRSTHVDQLIKLPAPSLQGGRSLVTFTGNVPMCGGVQYRVLVGALTAGDIINSYVGYTRDPGVPLTVPAEPVIDRRDLRFVLGSITGAAASTYVAASPAPGQTWKILWAEAHHDDAAGITGGYWGIFRGATNYQMSAVEVMAQWARSYFYDRVTRVPEAFILHHGDSLRYTGTVTAAGKHYILEHMYELRTGELGYGE